MLEDCVVGVTPYRKPHFTCACDVARVETSRVKYVEHMFYTSETCTLHIFYLNILMV